MKRSLSIIASLLVGCVLFTYSAWAGGAKHLAGTLTQVNTAYDQEWSSYLTYRAFAKQAEHEGATNAAVLFRALAEAELAHTGLHAAVLRWAGQDPNTKYQTPPFSMSTAENLEAALKSEQWAVNELYTPMLSLFESEKEPEAARAARFARAAEQSHAALCEELLRHDTLAAAWGDSLAPRWEGAPFYVCSTCGVVGRTLPSVHCPNCFADSRALLAVR